MTTLSMTYALSSANTQNRNLSEDCRAIKKRACNYNMETHADVNLLDNTLCITFFSCDDKPFGLSTAIELQYIVISELGKCNSMSFISGYFH